MPLHKSCKISYNVQYSALVARNLWKGCVAKINRIQQRTPIYDLAFQLSRTKRIVTCISVYREVQSVYKESCRYQIPCQWTTSPILQLYMRPSPEEGQLQVLCGFKRLTSREWTFVLKLLNLTDSTLPLSIKCGSASPQVDGTATSPDSFVYASNVNVPAKSARNSETPSRKIKREKVTYTLPVE